MFGIIASTEIEADLVIKQLSQKEKVSIQGKPFYKGLLVHNIPVVVCICGVGKVNAAHGTTLLIEKFKPYSVYNIGVGGAYPSSGLNIGDIAIAEKEIYGDEGLITEVRSQKSEIREKEETNFYAMDKLGLPLAIIDGNNYYNGFPMFIPGNLKKIISNPESAIRNLKSKIVKGNFVTVSTCTGTLKRGKELERRFNAICENMEGAAIAHICALSEIPVTEIRGISNIIEDRTASPLNKADIVKAAENVQKFFLKIFFNIK